MKLKQLKTHFIYFQGIFAPDWRKRSDLLWLPNLILRHSLWSDPGWNFGEFHIFHFIHFFHFCHFSDMGRNCASHQIWTPSPVYTEKKPKCCISRLRNQARLGSGWISSARHCAWPWKWLCLDWIHYAVPSKLHFQSASSIIFSQWWCFAQVFSFFCFFKLIFNVKK